METPVDTVRVARATFRARNTVPFALSLAAVAAFAFLSGGYVLGRNTPVAVALLCGVAVWVWFLRRSRRPPILFLLALGVFAAFAVWAGLSVLWSFGPDLTWVSFNLTGFYLAVVAVLGLTSARALQLWTVAYGYLAVATAVGVYAFLGKGLPAVVTHAHTYARLGSPVGYWNVLALMMVLGLLVALAIAGDRGTGAALRTAAAAAAVPMGFTFFFTLSRGGWLALIVALVLYFAFTTTRLASLFTLAAVVAPVALVLWRLRGLGTLFTETTDDALRTSQGGVLLRWAIAALLVTAGLQLAVALLHRGVRWPRWSAIAAGAVVLAVVVGVAVGGPGRYVQTHGGASWVKDKLHALLSDSSADGGGNDAGRLIIVSNNGRVELWREAARQSRYHRLAGTGAGTFPFTHYRFRTNGGVVKHAHSQWFNVLSELGVVGLVLFVAAVVLFVAAAVGNPFSRRRDPLHPLLVALQAGVIAFFVHISWDWDWDMAAIGTVVFVFIAVCASYRATRVTDGRQSRHASVDDAPAAEPAEEPPVEETTEGSSEGTLAEEVPAGVPAATAKTAAHMQAAADAPVAGGSVAGEPSADAPGAEEAGANEAIAGDLSERTAADGAHGAASGYERQSGRSRRRSHRVGWPLRVAASTALLLLAVSWLPPYLALQAENAALAAASDGKVSVALENARRAAALDPLAVSPLLTEAMLLQQLGRNQEALARLEAAAQLQPQNYQVWYELGVLLHGALGRDKAAKAAFTRALALNPSDAASRYELELLAQ
jgi:Flp pilus assembly protein TadD